MKKIYQIQRSHAIATEVIEAVYEHGGLRPIAIVGVYIAEGQTVRIVVEPIDQPDYILAWAAQVYEGLGEEQIDSIEQHARRREDFFVERIPS